MTSQVASTIDASRPPQGGTAPAVSESASGSDFLSFLTSAKPAVVPSASGGSTDSGQGDFSESKPVEEEDDEQPAEATSPGVIMVSVPVPAAPSVPQPSSQVPASSSSVTAPAGSDNASRLATSANRSEPAASDKPPEPARGNVSSQSLSGEPSLLASGAAVVSESPVNLTLAEAHSPLVRVLPNKQWTAVDSEKTETGADHSVSLGSDGSAILGGDSDSEDSPVSESSPLPNLSLSTMHSRRVELASGVLKMGQAAGSASALANDAVESLVAHTAQVQVPVGASSDSKPGLVTSSVPEAIKAEPGRTIPVETPKVSVSDEQVNAETQQAGEPGPVQDPKNKSVEFSVKPAASEVPTRQSEPLSEDGTPVAPPSKATMLAQQENKTAGLAGKKIPAGTQIVSFEAEGGEATSRMPRVHAVEGREPAIFAAYREGVAVTPDTGIPETLSQPVSFEAVEKAQALINDAAVRISKREGAALEVTIKPDAGTELTLHIRFHAGQIEARAVCQRGDYAALQSDWPELQERLLRQGIKLSGLENPGQQAFTGFTGQNPGQRRSTPDMAPELPVYAAPLNRNSKPTTQAARRVSSGNAWETWA